MQQKLFRSYFPPQEYIICRSDAMTIAKKEISMSIALIKRFHFTQALSSPSFALLWGSQTISSLGDGTFTIALAWQVLNLTGSAAALGLVLSAYFIPMIAFMLLGGIAADRFPRRMVMLLSDAGRAVAVLLIAVLSMAHLLQLWHLIVLSLFFGIVRGFFLPAYQSIVPQLVEKKDLTSANGLSELSYQLYQSLGPLLGAACIVLAGPAGAFGFDGLTFILSALCLVAVRLVPSTLDAPLLSAPERRPGVRSVGADLREGLLYVLGSPFLWVTILLVSIGNVGGAGFTLIALPKLVHDVYRTGPWLLGTLTASSGIGAILGVVVAGKLSLLRRRGLQMGLALLLASFGVLLFTLPLPFATLVIVLCIGMGLNGFGIAISNIFWYTLMQELVPDNKLGRVNSIDNLGSEALIPVGLALAGAFADRVSPLWIFLVAGVVGVVLAGIALSVRAIRCQQ
jgi:MFS family permease